MKKRIHKKKTTKIQKILYSRLFLGISFLIIIGVGSGLYDNYQQSREVYTEIYNLEQEVRDLEKKNHDVSDVIRYLNSTDYVEAQAKQKLGLSYADEKIVVITDDIIDRLKNSGLENLEDVDQDIIENMKIVASGRSNYKLWWDYFFNNIDKM